MFYLRVMLRIGRSTLHLPIGCLHPPSAKINHAALSQRLLLPTHTASISLPLPLFSHALLLQADMTARVGKKDDGGGYYWLHKPCSNGVRVAPALNNRVTLLLPLSARRSSEKGGGTSRGMEGKGSTLLHPHSKSSVPSRTQMMA